MKNDREIWAKPVYSDSSYDSTHLLLSIDERTFEGMGDMEKLISKYPFYYCFPFSMPILDMDPFYQGGLEEIKPERATALSVHRDYLFSFIVLPSKFIIKKEDEGYSLDPESIDVLSILRSLNELDNNPYSNEYVKHFEIFRGQLLCLEKFNKKRKEESLNTEIVTKDGKKIKWRDLIMTSEMRIPDSVACERFKMLRKNRGYNEFEKILRDYGLIGA